MYYKRPTEKRLSELRDIVDAVVAAALDIFREENGVREGGIFAYSDGVGGLYLVCPVGACFHETPTSKVLRYLSLAQEKVWRLKSHRADGHRSSFESQDPDNDLWPGAVWFYPEAGCGIYSFSGFKAQIDEAISLMVGLLDAGNTSAARNWAFLVATDNNNPYFARLLGYMEIRAAAQDLK